MATTTPPQRTPNQLLFGSVLLVLAALSVILLLKWVAEQPAGKSRVGWPPAAPAKKP